MVINNKYVHGQIVFIRTDKEQLPRIVITILVYKDGELLYKLACGTAASDHYEFELSETEDVELRCK